MTDPIDLDALEGDVLYYIKQSKELYAEMVDPLDGKIILQVINELRETRENWEISKEDWAHLEKENRGLRERIRGLEKLNRDIINEVAPLACIGGDILHCHHDGCPYEYSLNEENKKLKERIEELEGKVKELEEYATELEGFNKAIRENFKASMEEMQRRGKYE